MVQAEAKAKHTVRLNLFRTSAGAIKNKGYLHVVGFEPELSKPLQVIGAGDD